MAGNKIILDTNVVIDLFREHSDISKKFNAEKNIYIPITVIGELYHGAFYSGKFKKKEKQILKFISSCTILFIDTAIAIQYGKIKSELKKKGKPIPENDVWIAAIVLANNGVLISSDNHFKEVKRLKLKTWK